MRSYVNFSVALSATFAAIATPIQARQKPLNVVMIVVDDLRPELGCYGVEEVKTPNIDRLSKMGVVFKNAYCNIPVSGASRASLLTGVYPNAPKRFTHFACSASKDMPSAVPISSQFTQSGYHTVSNGKIFHNIDDHAATWSETPWRLYPNGYGKDWAVYNKYKLWANPESANHINPKTKRGPYCESADVEDDAYYDAHVAARGVEDLQRLSKGDKPFLLACGFWRPHLPFNAPKKYWDLYDRDKLSMADNYYRPEGLPKVVTSSGEIRGYADVDLKSEAKRREIKHGYYASVSYVDAQIGKLLDEIERLGLYKNTVVLLFGDHGWHLGEHTFWGKHNLMRNATNVPLIVAAPKGKRGVESESIVEFVDIYPTLCDLCGVSAPESQLDGVSMKPILRNPKATIKESAYVQWGRGTNVIGERYSYSEWRDGDNKRVQMMLFDHKNDPAENRNIASDPQHSDMVEQLSKHIAEWRRELK